MTVTLLENSNQKTEDRNRPQSIEGVSFGQADLPFEIIADSNQIDLSVWIKKNKKSVDQLLYRYGAILFRGFKVNNAEKLQHVVKAYTDEILDYVERGAPRLQLADKVYTSTEYAQEESIPLHHEMSYANNCPSKLFFCCEKKSVTGGFTPIANDREIIKKIPLSIQQKFLEKNVMYIRNYGLGIDMGWQEAFDTTCKSDVEEYLRKTDTEFEWISDDHLKTTAIRQVTAEHPITKDRVWFNHAHLFHLSNMPIDVREFLVDEFTESGLPRNAFYGDGTPIEDEVTEQIRQIYKSMSVVFPWQEGDVLLLDNFLVSHGRTPFEGERKICVAMAELYTHPKVKQTR